MNATLANPATPQPNGNGIRSTPLNKLLSLALSFTPQYLIPKNRGSTFAISNGFSSSIVTNGFNEFDARNIKYLSFIKIKGAF
jgi:hypothetical protein